MLGERCGRATIASVATIMVVALAFLVVGAPGARAAGRGPAGELAADTDAARASAGLPSYAYAGDLASVAQGQADRMAAAQRVYHNPNLASEVAGWRKVGENVGVGADAADVQQAFMASPTHRANILSSGYSEIGIGTTVGADGRLYVSEVFRLPDQSQPADAPAPDPQPAPVSDPAPEAPAPDVPVATPEPPAAPVPAPPPPAPVAVPVAAPIAAHPVAHRTNLVSREVRPQLVSAIVTVPRTYRGLSRMVWLAALLAQAVLLAHMITFWRRYRIGSGS